MPFVPNQFQWETVAIPLASGVDVTTRARLVDKQKLLKAENVFFPRNGGPEIRRGHRGFQVSDAEITNPVGSISPSYEDNLYGYGLFDSDSTITSSFSKSSYPQAGEIKGLASRNNEILAWDGHRFFNYHALDGKFTTNQNAAKTYVGSEIPHKACMPTASVTSLAKTGYAQGSTSMADNGTIKVVATVNSTASTAEIFCYDSESGSLKFREISSVVASSSIKVVNVGSYIHVYIYDGTNISLQVIHESNYFSETPVSLGASTTHFDVEKINESLVLLAKIDGTTPKLTYINSNGSINTTNFSANFTPDIGALTANKISVAVHRTTNDICLFFNEPVGPTQQVRIYNSTGTALMATTGVGAAASPSGVTCTANYLTDSGKSVFTLFYDNSSGSVYTASAYVTTVAAVTTNLMYNVLLTSKAFTVGNKPFVLCHYPSGLGLQDQHLLMDEFFSVCGRFGYGVATPQYTDKILVNYVIASNSWETFDFHFLMMVEDPDVIFKYVKLNFLPTFKYAQAGNTTYFPGAIMWAYDGVELTEANFIAGPENVTGSSSGAGGSMVAGEIYRYRVYLCHKSAAGEEITSIAVLGSEITVGGGHNRITLTGKTIPTNKANSYFLVYRNSNGGTTWNLASSRDLSSSLCPKNDMSSPTWSFVDTNASAALSSNELDPANNANYLHNWAPPPCENIAYGKDRLWISGGELEPGEVWVSKLFDPGYAPSFNPALGVLLDRTNEEITAIGFIADFAYVFKKNSVYIVTGSFSSNILGPSNESSQLALTNIGSVSHHLVKVSTGLAFQSAGGYKLIQPNGQVVSIGTDVDELASTCSGIVVSYKDRNIRFYQSDNSSLVYDYESGEWSTFTVQPTAAVYNPLSGYAVIVKKNRFLVEEEDLYTDDGAIYNATVRSAWLGLNPLGGAQRVRRVGIIGEKFIQYPFYTRNVYYDEKTYPEDSYVNAQISDLIDDSWGGPVGAESESEWGNGIPDLEFVGFWGSMSTGSLVIEADVFREIVRVAKQKCSVVSIEFVVSSEYGKSLVPTAFLLEVGNKNMPQRVVNTNSNQG